MNQGLTSQEFKTFSDLLIKANYLQLNVMQKEIGVEIVKRNVFYSRSTDDME